MVCGHGGLLYRPAIVSTLDACVISQVFGKEYITTLSMKLRIVVTLLSVFLLTNRCVRPTRASALPWLDTSNGGDLGMLESVDTYD